MPGSDQQNDKNKEKESVKKRVGFIKLKSSYVVGGSLLHISALMVVIFLALFPKVDPGPISKLLQQSPVRHSTPPSIQIVVLADGKKSASDVVMDTEKNPWIKEMVNALHNAVEIRGTGERLRADLGKRMGCAADERLSVSDYIQFASNASSIDAAAKNKINDFVCRVGGQATKWGVFGFASEPGDDKLNRSLSWKRACEVTKQICNASGFDCENGPDKEGTEMKCGDKSVRVFGQGEEHFINGAANSRSAVIAACTAEPDKADAGDEPRAAAPVCTARN